jgi:hypothetical protein
VRLGRERHAFWLEFDRGTMHAGRLRAKFAAYHRYARGQYLGRRYAGVPTLLVVTQGPGAEQRIGNAVLAADAGRSTLLRVMLTNADLVTGAPDGPFGPIWRTLSRPGRHRWPPGG